MYGARIGNLTVSYGLFNKEGIMTEDSKPLFLKNGDQGTNWQRAMVPLSPGNNFVLLLKAKSGGYYTSDIAIDDIVISEEACAVELTQRSVKVEKSNCYADIG